METKIEEIWKDVVGYEGLYQVSSLGRIYSHVTNKYLSLCINSKGYVIVVLTKDGEQKTFSVHRVVAIHFIPNPENLPQINHKKGIKYDNRVSQLEWTNQSKNQIHAYKLGLQKPCEAQKLGTAKHNKENYSKEVSQFTIDGIFVAKYYSASEAARRTGADQSNISATCRGKLRKHHNHVWKYT